jgi:hypothetical protein
MLFDALDVAATFVFAISGPAQGMRKRPDLFGVLVVVWAAGVASPATSRSARCRRPRSRRGASSPSLNPFVAAVLGMVT